MTASKQNVATTLMAGLTLVSFLVLMTAIQGDSTLRTALAAGGFVGFGGLLTALLVSKSRAKAQADI